MVGVPRELKDEVRNNFRDFIHEFDGQILLSADEVLSLIESLFSNVREEGTSWNDWLDVSKFASYFRWLICVILQVKLSFL